MKPHSAPAATLRLVGWRAVFVTAALVLIADGVTTGSAQNVARVASAESVKAAYLFKFPAYIDWPPDVFERPDSAVTIAVVEDERLADELASVSSGRTVGGRPILVRRLAAEDTLSDVHVLFAAPRDQARSAVESSAGRPILTVADAEAAHSGIVLSFLLVDGRVRFEVDLDEAQRRGLRLHSGLLAVAERVHGGQR